MACCNGEGTAVNSFALVAYLPEPLAGFLDCLRTDLVEESRAKAHVTILPPRPLICPVEEAWRELHDAVQDFQPIRVELGKIEIFPLTRVIYVSVNAGFAELKRLHDRLNTGCLAFEEPFDYHPHVTVAHEMERVCAEEAAEVARERWRKFSGPRCFEVDRLTLVQNTLENRWTDLRGCNLSANVTI